MNNCGTCRFWSKEGEEKWLRPNEARCINEHVLKLIENDDPYCGFTFNESFGCIFWESKIKSSTEESRT